MIATYRLVLLLAFHALKIATYQGSGAIIKDFCSRVLYDCDALGTALRYDGLLASIERKHKRIEDMARSTTSSRSGGAAASTTGTSLNSFPLKTRRTKLGLLFPALFCFFLSAFSRPK